jgi:L-amino acid N-acyltransferase YncA
LYVDALAVAPEARRAGVASDLYPALKERARSQGVRRINALITPDNDASMALHETVGFSLRDRKEAVIEL